MKFAAPDGLARMLVQPSDTQGMRVYLMVLPDGPPLCLEGAAGLIWWIAAEGDPDVAAAVAECLQVDADDIRVGVDNFVQQMVSGGLLEPLKLRE